MKYGYKISGLAAGVFLMAAVGASAATVSVQANAPESWAAVDTGATTTLSPGASWVTSPSIVAGSSAGHYKSPFDPANADNGTTVTGSDVVNNWDELAYFTIGSPNLVSSPAILALDHTKNILTLLWGSVDTYNAIELWLGGSKVATVSGQDVFDKGGEPAASGAALVRIFEAGGFDKVMFHSNFPGTGSDTPAFEFSNVVAAVPLPAGGLLLISALGGMAALRRRRNKAA